MKIVVIDNLDEGIKQFKSEGYRLDMIKPADAPREALMSKASETIQLVLNSEYPVAAGFESIETGIPNSVNGLTKIEKQEWIRGRAGMEYRDLIPGRLGGKVIASHIRLTESGEVPDYVHYHKVDFQMIYCKQGRIRLVYDDQGPPFWLETGDCILQPPEIRHRVLECTAGAEVIEVSMPAEHETWVEHEIELPTSNIVTDRIFGGQRFCRYIAATSHYVRSNAGGLLIRDFGFLAASAEFADVWNLRLVSDGKNRPQTGGMHGHPFHFYYVLKGDVVFGFYNNENASQRDVGQSLKKDDSFIIPAYKLYYLDCSPDVELLRVAIIK